MITHGSAEEVRRFINVLASYQLQPDDKIKGMPHISDMLITRKCRDELFGNNYVTESKPAIHFSSEQMTQFKDAVNELTGSAHPWSRQVGRTWLMNRVAQLQYTNRHSILILAPPGSDDQAITSLMAPLIDPWDSDDKLIIDTFAKQSWVREVRSGQHVASNSLLKRNAFTQSVTWLTQLPPNGLDFMDDIPGAVLFIWLTDPVKRVLQRYEEEKHFEQRHSRPRNSMSIALNALDHQSNVLNVWWRKRYLRIRECSLGLLMILVQADWCWNTLLDVSWEIMMMNGIEQGDVQAAIQPRNKKEYLRLMSTMMWHCINWLEGNLRK